MYVNIYLGILKYSYMYEEFLFSKGLFLEMKFCGFEFFLFRFRYNEDKIWKFLFFF